MPKDAQDVLPAALEQEGWEMVQVESMETMKAMSPGRTKYLPNSDHFRLRAFPTAPEVGQVPPWASPMPSTKRKRREADMSPSKCQAPHVGCQRLRHEESAWTSLILI